MGYVKFIKVVGFILLFSCFSTAFAGCNRENNDDLTDKEKFINQIKQDFNSSVNGEIIEFVVEPFAQSANLSAVFSIDFKILEGGIYFNDILYDSIKVISSPEISYNNALLSSANKSVTNDEVVTIMQKMQNSERCYMLETESNITISKKIAVYVIDGNYYFVSLSNSDELIRIHYKSV